MTTLSRFAGKSPGGCRSRNAGALVVMCCALAALKADAARPVADKKPSSEVLAASPEPVGPIVAVQRKRGQLGLPANHLCNAALPKTGYDNQLIVFRPESAADQRRVLFRPEQRRYVGEIDLSYDARHLLLTMPDDQSWHVWELSIEDSSLQRLTPQLADVDHFDACYLPDGRIVFASTASFTAVPCWHGKQRACCLYSIRADGSGMRQLCFDQDLDLHPSVLDSGQVVFSRWDYTGTMHAYLRPLMVMNPDGTGQRSVYGSNSYFPNALYFPRAVPGSPGKLAAILAGYHGVPRMGQLVLLDTSRGWHEDEGIVDWIACEPTAPVIRDRLIDDLWPKFLHPFPLDAERFLVAAKPRPRAPWGIYLAERSDKLTPLLVDPRFDFFEPIPLRRRPEPPAIPDRVEPQRHDAVVYLHNVYAGPGLRGVPHGAVDRLRVVAYEFGYPGMAGPDKIGSGGPWEPLRILGTVPVAEDGSAVFRVPARTPICVQPLDAEGKALQLMRSWFTAMPGEKVSCVGCHEPPRQTPVVRYEQAATKEPTEIEPWHGPPRGFDFAREVQPVLDRYCVACHNAKADTPGAAAPDLNLEGFADHYCGRPLTRLGSERLDPQVRQAWGGNRVRYTPAYEALLPYIRRVGIEDDVNLLVPGEYHADTSELVQLLAKGHHGVLLDSESWDRLVTWIDLNGPCHGTWRDVGPIPGDADQRRRELAARCGGPVAVAEVRATPDAPLTRLQPSLQAARKCEPSVEPSAPHTATASADDEIRQRPLAEPLPRRVLDLGGGVELELVRVPGGRFVMGSVDGPADERPATLVTVDDAYWIGAHEITVEQFRQYAPDFRPGYFMKRYPSMDGPGLALDGLQQPALRVSWRQARAFCAWLSKRTGLACDLPTEAQWEYACRAGTTTPLCYGATDADFSPSANMADAALAREPSRTAGLESNVTTPRVEKGEYRLPPGGDIPCEVRSDDGFVATAPVASFRANAWGLYDMHGNAAEWTRSLYRSYPYRPDDGRNNPGLQGERVVRGGSFRDRPKRCTSSYRLGFPPWQRVHHAGFRVVCGVAGNQADN